MLTHILNRKKQSAKLTITDFSKEMLAFAAAKAKSLLQDPFSNLYAIKSDVEKFDADLTFDKLNLSIKCLNAENLSGIPDGSVDAYLASLVLQLVSDPKQAVSESYRVLSKNGRCIFSVW